MSFQVEETLCNICLSILCIIEHRSESKQFICLSMLILRVANRISQVVEAKAFSVFDCTPAPPAAWETHILRIANAISQQGDALKMQWEDIMPRARHAVSTLHRDYASNKDSVCANKKALRQAITRI